MYKGNAIAFSMLEIKNTTIIPEHVLSFILALLGCVNHNTSVSRCIPLIQSNEWTIISPQKKTKKNKNPKLWRDKTLASKFYFWTPKDRYGFNIYTVKSNSKGFKD